MYSLLSLSCVHAPAEYTLCLKDTSHLSLRFRLHFYSVYIIHGKEGNQQNYILSEILDFRSKLNTTLTTLLLINFTFTHHNFLSNSRGMVAIFIQGR